MSLFKQYTIDNYNVSSMVYVFNSIPHLQLINNNGLIIRKLSNTTFDYGRFAYVNSILITFLLPLIFLFVIFTIYILYLFILKFLEPEIVIKRQKIYHSKRQQIIRSILITFGFLTISILAIGSAFFIKGYNDTNNSLNEFIQASNNSKQTVREWNKYIQPDNSLINGNNNGNNGHVSYLKRLNDTVELYTNSSTTKRLQRGQQIYQWSTLSLISMNIFNILIMLIYWLSLLIFGCYYIRHYEYNDDDYDDTDTRLKRWILVTFILVIVQIFLFDSHLCLTIMQSDFCLSAKQSLTDLVVHKFPENNYTIEMARYYLHCDLPKHFQLQKHKHNVINYLNDIDQSNIFQSSLGMIIKENWNVIDLLKKNINETYQTITCENINSIINNCLTQYCTEPINGLLLLTFGHLAQFTLIIIILFIITFAY